MKIYTDTRDWWIGYYRGPHHHYVCPLPCLVIRWARKEQAPQEVRITRADGTVIRCGVLRDPDGDYDGLAFWRAEPLEPYEHRQGDTVDIGLLPPRTVVGMSLLVREEPG